jgi:outer membrane murein-binding lipoprotein Lpp
VATVPQGGFSDTLTIGAVALSVLLLGGVIGSIARRRSF